MHVACKHADVETLFHLIVFCIFEFASIIAVQRGVTFLDMVYILRDL
jgi:hypothetical protein